MIFTLTGLYHIEGETVSILADGLVLPSQVVNNGEIVLDEAYAVVHVGLPYNADVETVPIIQ